MDVEELKVISDLTLKLTELKLSKVEHLAVENFAAECFGKLIYFYQNFEKINDPQYKSIDS